VSSYTGPIAIALYAPPNSTTLVTVPGPPAALVVVLAVLLVLVVPLLDVGAPPVEAVVVLDAGAPPALELLVTPAPAMPWSAEPLHAPRTSQLTKKARLLRKRLVMGRPCRSVPARAGEHEESAAGTEGSREAAPNVPPMPSVDAG
jgi:hypothetical protein